MWLAVRYDYHSVFQANIIELHKKASVILHLYNLEPPELILYTFSSLQKLDQFPEFWRFATYGGIFLTIEALGHLWVSLDVV